MFSNWRIASQTIGNSTSTVTPFVPKWAYRNSNLKKIPLTIKTKIWVETGSFGLLSQCTFFPSQREFHQHPQLKQNLLFVQYVYRILNLLLFSFHQSARLHISLTAEENQWQPLFVVADSTRVEILVDLSLSVEDAETQTTAQYGKLH